MGWTTEESWFISWQGKEIFIFFENVRTGPGIYPASYSVDTRSSIPGDRAGGS